MKVLHLPTSVGGHAWGLAQAERAAGIDAKVLVLYGNYIEYAADYAPHLERHGKLSRALAHLHLAFEFRRGFDAYHFNYGSSLLHFLNRGVTLLDLPFYDRAARKVFTFNGCDARQKYPTMERNNALGSSVAACFEAECYGGMCNSGALDRHRRTAIDKAARHANHIFAVNPDILYFLPTEISSFLPYSLPLASVPRPRRPAGDRMRIVHAPTDRVAKGSRYILRALEELQEEFGSALEVLVVERRPHAEALALYAGADLFIDQVLIGWYGGVAVEAMQMGVPVACFINEDHLRFVPPAMAAELPFLRITPFDIKERVRAFLRDRDYAHDLARRAATFVARWHHPSVAAAMTAVAYRGEHPAAPEPYCGASEPCAAVSQLNAVGVSPDRGAGGKPAASWI